MLVVTCSGESRQEHHETRTRPGTGRGFASVSRVADRGRSRQNSLRDREIVLDRFFEGVRAAGSTTSTVRRDATTFALVRRSDGRTTATIYRLSVARHTALDRIKKRHVRNEHDFLIAVSATPRR